MTTSIDERLTTPPHPESAPDDEQEPRRSWTGIAYIALAVLAVIAAIIPLLSPVRRVLAVMRLIFGLESLARRAGSRLVPVIGITSCLVALAIALIVGIVTSQPAATEPPVPGPPSADQSE